MKQNTFLSITESTVKAGISMIPLVGGPISSIIGDVSQERYKKRIKEFIDNVNKALSNRLEEIDREKISKEDFQDIFSNCFQAILTNRIAEKRTAFTNILINTIAYNNISFDESEYMMKLIDNLTLKHLICMEELSKVKIPDYSEGVAETTLRTISEKYELFEYDVFESIKDLENYNIAQGFTSQYLARGGRGGVVLTGIDSYLTVKGEKLLSNIKI